MRRAQRRPALNINAVLVLQYCERAPKSLRSRSIIQSEVGRHTDEQLVYSTPIHRRGFVDPIESAPKLASYILIERSAVRNFWLVGEDNRVHRYSTELRSQRLRERRALSKAATRSIHARLASETLIA